MWKLSGSIASVQGFLTHQAAGTITQLLLAHVIAWQIVSTRWYCRHAFLLLHKQMGVRHMHTYTHLYISHADYASSRPPTHILSGESHGPTWELPQLDLLLTLLDTSLSQPVPEDPPVWHEVKDHQTYTSEALQIITSVASRKKKIFLRGNFFSLSLCWQEYICWKWLFYEPFINSPICSESISSASASWKATFFFLFELWRNLSLCSKPIGSLHTSPL